MPQLKERITVQVPAASSAWLDSGMVMPATHALLVEVFGNPQFNPGFYSYPEGIYDHGELVAYYEPALVDNFSDGYPDALTYPGSNLVPGCLVLMLLPDGAGAPPAVGNTDTLRPNRRYDYSAQEIADNGGGGGPWRVWLIYNSSVFADNLGEFTVTLSRYGPGGTFDMSDRNALLQKPRIGREATLYTPATPNVEFNLIRLGPPRSQQESTLIRAEGSKRPGKTLLQKEHTVLPIAGEADYNEVGWLLCAGVDGAPPVDDLGAGVYEHIFTSKSFEKDTLQGITCQYGSSDGFEEVNGILVDSLGFRANDQRVEIQGSAWGRRFKDSVNDVLSLAVGANAVQTLTSDGTGGTIGLSYNGSEYTYVAFDASAATIQTAIQALSTVGAGNILVAGSGPWTFTGASALAGKNLPLIQVDNTNLTGGEAAIVMTTSGGLTRYPKCPIARGEVDVYIADDLDGLDDGANQLLRSFSVDWSLGNRTAPFWTQNSSLGVNPTSYMEGEAAEMLDIILGADAQAMALRDAQATGARKYIRIVYTSSQFTIAASGTPYRFILDASVEVNAVKEFGSQGNVYALGFELRMLEDENWGGNAYQFRLRNGISSYTS